MSGALVYAALAVVGLAAAVCAVWSDRTDHHSGPARPVRLYDWADDEEWAK